MFEINPFRSAVPIYPEPIAVPLCDPDFATVNVALSCAWLPLIAGACKALTMQATWDTDDPDTLALAIQRAEDLLVIFAEAMAGSDCVPIPVAQDCQYDLTVNDGDWFVVGGQGSYTPSVGYEPVTISGQPQITIERSYAAALSLTNFRIEWNSDGASSSPGVGLIADFGSGPVALATSSDPWISGTNSFEWSGRQDGCLDLYVSMNSGLGPGPNYELFNIRVEGLTTESFDC